MSRRRQQLFCSCEDHRTRGRRGPSRALQAGWGEQGTAQAGVGTRAELPKCPPPPFHRLWVEMLYHPP